ncbi:von Willebrand factor A domain-containing protein 8 [Varanus komodoensis]|nr:von Willebrand factor A domain-containing protein 8 [Varanus komodoensis]
MYKKDIFHINMKLFALFLVLYFLFAWKSTLFLFWFPVLVAELVAFLQAVCWPLCELKCWTRWNLGLTQQESSSWAKGKERQWLRHQVIGELDDAKIIDGLTGEKAIYKRRGDVEPQLGSPQEKPKRLRLVVDVSGSMYRFNGVDGRLERSMEAVCMVMEAFENYEQKFKYDIKGHSGDGFNIALVQSDKVPKNNKQRLEILKTMHAHAQFCMSGDHTLEGTAHAIREIAQEEADEHFVVVLSDANLERYGIPAAEFARTLTLDPKVNAFAVFIGSLGSQADRLQRTLPAGRSFIAMDTKGLPQILQQIFASTMLSSS